MTTASSTYALRLSDDELGRYRMMAARARAEEGDLWTQAGIVPGARVADVGCGPGAMLVTLAEVVGPTGHVIGVDADPAAVAPPAPRSPRPGLSGDVAPGAVRHGRARHGAPARIGRHGRAAPRARPQRRGRSSGSSTISRRSCAPAATSTSSTST